MATSRFPGPRYMSTAMPVSPSWGPLPALPIPEPFGHWPQLCEELAHAVQAERAVLDGEITWIQPDVRPDFHALMLSTS